MMSEQKGCWKNMKHVTDEEYCNLGMKTELQWAREKKLPNKECEGTPLWCNPHHQNQATYYRPDEVHEATKDELDAFLEPYRAKKRESRKRLNEKKERLRKKELEESYKRGVDDTLLKIRKVKNSLYDSLSKMTFNTSQSICNKHDKIVFDIETTGFNPVVDEILQISIISGEGKELLNSYVKPYFADEWEDAEKVNGISKEMVEKAPFPHELMNTVQNIFSSAKTWIAYNGDFDLDFLSHWGIVPGAGNEIIDVMEEFTPLYGEYNYRHKNFKWQNLTTCANYFNYDFKAHDSLEDTRATLHCYNCMKKMQDEGTYQEIVDRNYQIYCESEEY